MVPHVEIPDLRLFGTPLSPFHLIIAAGMVLTYFLGLRRVRAEGLYAPVGAAGLVWVAVGGYIGAHLLEALAYQPQRLMEEPLWLMAVWDGWSSFGGFIGGTVALYLFCQRQGVWMLAYLDALVHGFAPGWIIARSACFFAHDHLGPRTDFFLAVAYEGGARHNLGFYEVLLAAVITAALYALPSRPRFVGFYTALAMLLYAPGRFALDTLRTGDARYLGLTPAQYLCAVMVAIAAYLVVQGRQRGVRSEGDQTQTQED